MPRAGVTHKRVVAEAAAVAEEVGLKRLTLAATAQRFGVTLPSLYRHVDGLDALKRRARRESVSIPRLTSSGNVIPLLTEPMSSENQMTETATSAPRVIGRPRDERADRAILAATVELMAEDGVRDLRVDDVAGRAGVGKATIYRRYRSKDELIAAAVAGLVREIAVPDSGRTRADLLALMRGAVAVYRGSVEAAVMPSLVEAMGKDAELARLVRDGVLARRRAALRAVIERGIERGDLRSDLDLELALDVLGGPLFYRLLITGGPIDEQLAQGVVELILRGFAPTTKSSKRKKETP
jgi:AcrR family transcriptional regulator